MRERIGQRPFELIALGVAATIATHASHLPLWLTFGAAGAISMRAWLRRRSAKPVPAWLRLPAAALLLFAVIEQFGTVFGREPGSVLGCGLLALKLLETEHARDARVAVGFAGFVLMSALLFEQSLAFTLGVSLILIVLLAALVALQPAPIETARPLRAELRLATRLLAAALPFAVLAFLLIPRLGSPLWGAPGRDMEARTGLSERMQPGAIGELLLDDTPAMRVSFDGVPPPPSQRYFRAIVLWDFDGATWTRERRDGFLRPESAQAAGAPLNYTITLEPTDRRWLPALDMPLAAPGGAHFGADRVLIADDLISQPREYRMRSATVYKLAPELTAKERERALALPDGFDPRSRAMALRWRNANDESGVIRSALDLFHASFTYSLDVPPLARDSVDDFLFSTRKGFCEHYASAFVVLMRAAGIPARVVTGYQGGWWNDSSGYLLVRNSDAHAWAEVWREGRGWVRVDPTAAVSPARIELGAAAANDASAWSQSAWLRALRNEFDFANGLWTRTIIRFDALRQKSMLTPFGVDSANQGDLLLAFSIALGVFLLAATLWAMRDVARTSDDALDLAWTRFARRLADAGVARKPGEGPLDFLSRARRALPASANALGELVQNYVALRYGAIEPAPERVRAFTRAVRNFRVSTRVS